MIQKLSFFHFYIPHKSEINRFTFACNLITGNLLIWQYFLYILSISHSLSKLHFKSMRFSWFLNNSHSTFLLSSLFLFYCSPPFFFKKLKYFFFLSLSLLTLGTSIRGIFIGGFYYLKSTCKLLYFWDWLLTK